MHDQIWFRPDFWAVVLSALVLLVAAVFWLSAIFWKLHTLARDVRIHAAKFEVNLNKHEVQLVDHEGRIIRLEIR